MTFDEAMAMLPDHHIMKREGWVKKTVRMLPLPDTYIALEEDLGRPPRQPYAPGDEDKAATDWREAQPGEYPWD